MQKTVINSGDRHKDWLVIREVEKRGKNRCFLCQCLICNNEYEVHYGNLTSKNNSFCCNPCSKSRRFEINANELIGRKFGRLTVISKHSQDNSDKWQYLCRCECGNEKVIRGADLKNGKVLSCGCYKNEKTIERSSGENSNFWIDGRTPQNQLDRSRIRESLNPLVRARDNHTCQNCGQYKGYLNIHHIFDFSTYPKLRFEESNLIVLCRQCHLDFHKIYPTYETNTLNDLEDWMGQEYKYKLELLQLL